MSNINGFDNEYQFVLQLNGKKVGELSPLLRCVIDELFQNNNENDYIRSWRNHYKQKSDIFIKINNEIKGISIKKGMKNSMHTEEIDKFINFLKLCGVEKNIINDYLKYHYADGTINGSGKLRMSAEEYKTIFQDSIDKINNVLNNETILKKAIKRFVIKGTNSAFYIQGIMCGEFDDFLWINKDDIENIILSKKDCYSTAVHFGPLICQPKNRCLNYNPKYEKDRHCIQIKWYSLCDDIIENMDNRIKDKCK